MSDTGNLDHSPEAAGAKMLWQDFTVDLATGAVRRLGSLSEFSVVQIGDAENDTVLVLNGIDGRPSLRNATSDFLRVRHWDGMSLPVFLAYSLSSVVTGICVEL